MKISIYYKIPIFKTKIRIQTMFRIKNTLRIKNIFYFNYFIDFFKNIIFIFFI